MKSKKSMMLAEKVTSIIIAALCLVILVYLGAKLYNNTDNKEKSAENSIDSFNYLLRNLKVDQPEEFSFVGLEKWFVSQKEDKICICNSEFCDKKSFCQDFNEPILFMGIAWTSNDFLVSDFIKINNPIETFSVQKIKLDESIYFFNSPSSLGFKGDTNVNYERLNTLLFKYNKLDEKWLLTSDFSNWLSIQENNQKSSEGRISTQISPDDSIKVFLNLLEKCDEKQGQELFNQLGIKPLGEVYLVEYKNE